MKYTLDVRNMLCPMPVIKTQNKVKQLQVGDELEIMVTDPGALNDIPCWCRMRGHQIISTQQTATDIVILLQVGEK